jgi:hypothetical protein
VSGINDSRDADFEEANSQLLAGLKSCRSVVENYRAMLSAESDADRRARDGESGESFE